MTNALLRDPKLAQLYRRAPGAIAFVDESFRAVPQGRDRAFYSMSAVTLEKDQLDRVRTVLTDVAGCSGWHTTDANQDGRHRDIGRMVRFLAGESVWHVVAVEATVAPGDGGLRVARSTCLAAIAREVQRGHGPGAVRLLVADNNRLERLNADDQRTIHRLRSAGDIDANVALCHTRMSLDPALWSADVLSWSAYRNLATDDGRWIEPLRDVLTVLDARTGRSVEMKQPQAAAATPGAQQTTGVRRGQSAVASEISLARNGFWEPVEPGPDVAGSFRSGTSVLDDLAAQVARLRRDVGVRGITEGNTPRAVAIRSRRGAGTGSHAPPSRRRRDAPVAG